MKRFNQYMNGEREFNPKEVKLEFPPDTEIVVGNGIDSGFREELKQLKEGI